MACPDGVWLVDLAPIADQTLVASAVLTALQLPPTTGSPLDVVVAYLKTRRLFLILDNCEHVIAQAREVASQYRAVVPTCARAGDQPRGVGRLGASGFIGCRRWRFHPILAKPRKTHSGMARSHCSSIVRSRSTLGLC